MLTLIRHRIHTFRNRVYRTRSGILTDSVFAPWHHNVIAALYEGDDPRPRAILGKNIVTNAGDLHYAQKAAGEAVTNAFGVLELCSAGTPAKDADRSAFTTIAGTEKVHDSGYPKTNDDDADNTGAGTDIVTYRTSYTKGDFNATGISHGIITNATPGASEPILTGYAFSSAFDKTADDTLKVFTNHQMNGV